MSHVTVIGATGYAGAAIVAEAARRGHTVTAVSRSLPDAPLAGVRYVTGSALEPAVLADALAGSSAVVLATSPRGDMLEQQVRLVDAVAAAADAAGIRYVSIGGFSSLRPAEGAPRVIEGDIPEAYRAEALAGHQSLEHLLETPESLDYVFVSPAARFSAHVPTPASGSYRLGGEVAILDEEGASYLAPEDLALAVVDLIESGEHRRGHVSVVSGE